jgi:hypothetical protein
MSDLAVSTDASGALGSPAYPARDLRGVDSVGARWPTPRSVRVCPAARDDPPVPAKQRLGRNEERVPRTPRDDPT